VISDPTTATFRRSRASPLRLSSSTLLSDQATNAWAVGASTDDVPTLSTLGGVVRSMGATTDALHPGWLGPAQGFGHEGYYIGDDRYRHNGHQQDRKASGQENQTVQNAKPDHPVS
jgi:hypothetical protein